MRRTKTKTNYDICLRNYPGFAKNAITHFENKGKNRGFLVVEKNGYKINYEKIKGSLKSECPCDKTIKKFALLLWKLKHNEFRDIDENKLAVSSRVFHPLWKAITGENWITFIKNNNVLRGYDKWDERGFPSNGTFRDCVELFPISHREGVINPNTPALVCGVLATWTCAEYADWLLKFVEDNNLKFMIVGQNPDSQNVNSVADRMGWKEVEVFEEIAKSCRNLSDRSSGRIRVDFSYDVEDYLYQGIFSKNRYNLSLSLHLYLPLDKETDKGYSTISNNDIERSVNIFSRMESRYGADFWDW